MGNYPSPEICINTSKVVVLVDSPVSSTTPINCNASSSTFSQYLLPHPERGLRTLPRAALRGRRDSIRRSCPQGLREATRMPTDTPLLSHNLTKWLQWKFVSTGKNIYRIINAAHSADSEDTFFALGVDATNKSTTTEDEATGKTLWTVNIPAESPYCTYVESHR